MDALNKAAVAEKSRSSIIEEKLKQTELLAKIECLKNPQSRYCPNASGGSATGGKARAGTDPFAMDPSAPPLKSTSGRYTFGAPTAAGKTAKKSKYQAKSKQPSNPVMAMVPAAPVSFGPRVVGVVQQNGAAAVMVEQNGQILTVKAGEMVGGRQVGTITRCSVELGGMPVSVCNEVGQTPLTSTTQTARTSKTGSPFLQEAVQGGQPPNPPANGDPFMAAPLAPQPNGATPIIPAPIGSTPMTAAHS